MRNRKLSFWTFKTRQEYQDACVERIIERAEKLSSNGFIKSAISCYEGALKSYWNAMEIQHRLGMLHLETGDQVKAGRYFYFKKDLTESELECVRLFEQRFGNDPVLILKRLLNKERQPASKLDMYTKQKLNDLINEAFLRNASVPIFARGMKRHFEKIGLKKVL